MPEVLKVSERIRFQDRLRTTLLPGVERWMAAAANPTPPRG